MKNKILHIIILLFSFLIFNCSSLTENGYTALNDSKYEEALNLFQRAILENKNDEKAIQGLKTTQKAWIEKKLIEVRLLRLAQNFGESEILLKNLISNQNEWQVFPSGAAFSTQKEEIQFLTDRITNNIHQYLKKNNPLAAQIEYIKNKKLMNDTLKVNTLNLEKQIDKVGKEFCNQTEKTINSNDFFTFEWLKKTCEVWNYNLKEKKLVTSVKLFKSLSINTLIEGLNEDETSSLQKAITDSFLKSKWYDPQGILNLSITLKGQFKSQQNELEINRTAHYTIEEPYEVSKIRIKETSKKENNSVLGSLLFLMSNKNERSIDNHDGTETVYETKYKTVDKYFPYVAVEVSATKEIQAKLDALLHDQIFSTQINGTYNLKSDRHNQNFPQAGLTPQNPKIISNKDWITTVYPNWTNKLTDELKKHWLNRFCLTIENNSTLSIREQILRCTHQVDTNIPSLVKDYFKQNYEVKFEDWIQVFRP